MDDTRFWSVVASLGPDLLPARLAMVLNSLTPADLDGFCICLDRAENDLDTGPHRAEADAAYEMVGAAGVERAWNAPDDLRPVVFDELRATVVAHGQDAWRAVVAAPPLLSGGWPTGLGRQFMAAVATAVRRSLRTFQVA